MPEVPIIFIHYGWSWYLRSTLRAARLSNPGKRIVLLGDEKNRCCAEGLAEYFPYDEFAKGERLAAFDKVFRVVQGRDHKFNKAGGTEQWLRFVFRRWFMIGEFVDTHKISSLWTFDSDTLLLAELGRRERRYRDFVATTQCRGRCLNSWIGETSIITRYLEAMIEMFSDERFLEQQEQRLTTHTGQAFNEMDAFAEFARREGIVTPHAAEPVEGEAFDDAIASVPGYEPSDLLVHGRIKVKALWRDSAAGLYSKRSSDGQYVRWLSCNMSWMPPGVWCGLKPFVLSPQADAKVRASCPGSLEPVLLKESRWDRWLEPLRLRGKFV